MFKKIITVLTLCLSLSVTVAQTIPDDQRQIIVEEVMAELGFYDAAEIEARVRLWLLMQPIPRASGETLEQGICQSAGCEPTESTGTLPMPRKVKVKGKTNNGKYTQNLKVKWKRPKALPEGSSYTFSYYEVYLAKNSNSYEYFRVDPKYKNNGKLKLHQSIKFKGLEQADYQVQLRAVYEQTSAKSTNTKALLGGSGWTDPNAIPVLKPGSTVAHLDTSSALYSCVKARGFADTTVLTDITILNCTAKNLTDADMGYLTNFTGLVQLNIKKNYAITKIGLLSDLPLLNWLHLAKISTITDLNTLKDFDSLQTIFIKEMGLTKIPELPASITYINASFNNITSNAGGFFPDHTVTTLVLNSYADHRNGPGLTNTFFNSLAGKSIKILTATNSRLSDITIISNINNITDTNLSGSDIRGPIDISQFEGDCSISLNNTKITEVYGTTTVPAVSLRDNRSLRLVRTFTENGQAPNYETIFPHFTYMQGSDALYCDHYYELVDAWALMSSNNKQTISTKTTLEECLYPAVVQRVLLPTMCKPNTATDFSAIKDPDSTRYLLSWSKLDLDVRSVKFYHLKVNGVLRSGSIPVDFQLPLAVNIAGASLATFEVQACTTDANNPESCGDWLTATVKTGLGKVSNLDVEFGETGTANNTSFDGTFKLLFDYSYPNDASHIVPDYFKVEPVFPQPPTATTIATIAYGSSPNQSSWITADNYFGSNYQVKACTNSGECGAGVSINIDIPTIAGADILAPTGTNSCNTATGKVLANITNAANLEIDYFKVVETQPISSITHGPGSATTAITYYVEANESGTASLNLSRKVNGQYAFKIYACIRDRDNGDVCSAPDFDIPFQTRPLSYYVFVCSINQVTNSNLQTEDGLFRSQNGSPFNLQWYPQDCLASDDANCGTTYQKKGLKWTYDSSSVDEPDYFYLAKSNLSASGTNTSATHAQSFNSCIASQQKVYDVHNNQPIE
ncbi:MAG: hypothetical protein JKY19_01290, partial [Alcanivoracaceae bacterium]|nr:hypothetical protein [Alcanivoracaceae bacterium]